MPQIKSRVRMPAVLASFAILSASFALVSCGGSSGTTSTGKAATSAAVGATGTTNASTATTAPPATTGTATTSTGTTSTSTSATGNTGSTGQGTTSAKTTESKPSSTQPKSTAPAVKPPPVPSKSRVASLVACLKAHGVTLLKDKGGSTAAQYQAAISKCIGKLHLHVKAPLLPKPSTKSQTKLRLVALAECLRTEGIHIPAPNTSGNGPVLNLKGVDTSSAAYKAALTKCQAVGG
jgi:hypothetical protein